MDSPQSTLELRFKGAFFFVEPQTLRYRIPTPLNWIIVALLGLTIALTAALDSWPPELSAELAQVPNETAPNDVRIAFADRLEEHTPWWRFGLAILGVAVMALSADGLKHPACRNALAVYAIAGLGGLTFLYGSAVVAESYTLAEVLDEISQATPSDQLPSALSTYLAQSQFKHGLATTATGALITLLSGYMIYRVSRPRYSETATRP